MNASDLDGFDSPNFRPLITVGVDYEVAWDRILQPPVGALEVDTRFEEHVVVITLFPGGCGHRLTAPHDDLIASLRKRW